MAALLERNGFKIRTARHFEVNLILDTPDNSLRARGQLLRVRSAGDRAVVTFKGTATIGRHKSREEVEYEAGDFSSALTVFERLGYVVRFRYEKHRTEYQRLGDPGHIALDETPIGNYIEVEGPPEWIDSTARKLGFVESDYLTVSYGRLYLAWCAERGIEPTHMTIDPPTA